MSIKIEPMAEDPYMDLFYPIESSQVEEVLVMKSEVEGEYFDENTGDDTNSNSNEDGSNNMSLKSKKKSRKNAKQSNNLKSKSTKEKTTKRIHKCEVCLRTYQHKQHLLRHYQQHTATGYQEHNIAKSPKCILNGKEKTTKNEITCVIDEKKDDALNSRRTRRNASTENCLDDAIAKPYKCKICSNSYIRYQHFLRHHRQEHPVNCESCTIDCVNTAGYSAHIKTHPDCSKAIKQMPAEKRYECKLCSKYFNRNENLKRHHLQQHGLVCFQCLEIFSSQNDLSAHISKNPMCKDKRKITERKKIEDGIGKILFQCSLCPLSYARACHLHRHQREHHASTCVSCKLDCGTLPAYGQHLIDRPECVVKRKKKVHHCDICNRDFHLKDKFQIHLRTHSGEKPFICDYCSKGYRCKDHLKTHMAIHSGITSIKCEICGFGALNKSKLKYHMLTHSDERPFSCEKCSTSFKTIGSLNHHMKVIHATKMAFNCMHCGKAFKQLGNLKNHEIRHSGQGERTFACDICGKGFLFNIDLRYHKRTHTGERPYPCKLCSARFADISNLHKHIRIHTGEKPYKCTVCQKDFNQQSSLNSHKKIHIICKPFKCKHCAKEFGLEADLQVHVRIHGDIQKFKCDICDTEYDQLSHMKSHRRLHFFTINDAESLRNEIMPDITDEYFNIGSMENDPPSTISSKIYDKPSNLDNHCLSSLTEESIQDAESLRNEIMLDIPDEHCNVGPIENDPQSEIGSIIYAKPSILDNNYFESNKIESLLNDESQLNNRLSPKLEEDYNLSNDDVFQDELYSADLSDNDEIVAQESIAADNNCDSDKTVKRPTRSTKVKESIKLEFDCDECDASFGRKENLCLHKFRNHSTYVCDECGIDCLHWRGYRKHMRENRVCKKRKTHQCKLCDRTFRAKDKLAIHTLSHTGERPFICDYCGKAYRTKDNLRIHILKHTGLSPFKCDICGQLLATKSHLKKHLLQHSDQRLFQCEICSKAFKTNFQLKAHANIHREDMFKCSYCAKGFKVLGNLKSHELRHEGGDKQKFPCTVCAKIFMFKLDLKYHMRTHTGERPYPCTYCEARFADGSNLKKHLRIHTGEKPFQCNICGKDFNQLSSLNNHRKSHETFKPYTCEYCAKTFATDNDLRKHLRIHGDIRMFKCDMCDNEYEQLCHLKSHTRLHYGNKVNNVKAETTRI